MLAHHKSGKKVVVFVLEPQFYFLKHSCHVLDILNLKCLHEVPLQRTVDDIEESNKDDEEIDSDKLSLLIGVKLPKRDSDRQIVNDYFSR